MDGKEDVKVRRGREGDGEEMARVVVAAMPEVSSIEALSKTFATSQVETRLGDDNMDAWIAVVGRESAQGEEEEEHVVGVMEVKGESHLMALFVDPAWQGRGIGSLLLTASPSPLATVNSSPSSVGFYLRHGFQATGEEVHHNGVSFIPMARPNPSLSCTNPSES